MRKHRLLIFLLVAVLVFTPTVILIVRAASIGRFPKQNQVQSIEITAENGKVESLDASDPLWSAFFEVLQRSERIASSRLPDGCEAFDVALRLSDNATERIRLYFLRSDCSLYIKNSENRLFAFRDPELELLDTVLPPTKIELCARGEDVPLLSYPNDAEKPAQEIVLSKWDKLDELISLPNYEQATFNLYQKISKYESRFVREIEDFGALSDVNSDYFVLGVVRWTLSEEYDLLHYYFFSLGEP